MKIVSLEIKKIKVGRFFPREGRAEFHIMFDDGAEKEIKKEVDFADSENAAENVLIVLRKLEKRIHSDDENYGMTLENFVNIVIKDEDKVLKEISNFIQKIGIKISEINDKKEADGYLDRIRELKNMELAL